MKTRPLPWPLRTTALLLAVLQALLSAPLWALNPPEPLPPRAEPALPPAPEVTVNRTMPEGEPAFVLPAQPTDQEITGCGLLSEPLVPLPGPGDRAENAALSGALQRYRDRADRDDDSALAGFCERHPASRWSLGLWHNLGIIHYHQGEFSKALDDWECAWSLGKAATGGPTRALANQAFAELVRMNARLGRKARVEELLAESADRPFTGSAAEVLVDTKDALALMKHDPGHSFRCGPLALAEIRASEGLAEDKAISAAESTPRGCSLAQVAELARAAGMNYQLARRDAGAPVVTPCVVHWKVGHYAALIKQDQGKYLSQDLTFGNDTWLSPRVLDEEASGYFLVPQGALLAGWRPVAAAEAARIWGCGSTSSNEPGHQSPRDVDSNACPKNPSGNTGQGTGGATGVPQYNVKAQSVSLTIFDVPVGYQPPVGPTPQFVVTYNHRADGQPATLTFSNLGQNWSHDWMAYVADSPATPQADVQLFNRGGGYQTYSALDAITQRYALDLITNTQLVKTSPSSYERDFPDGSKELYTLSNNVTGPGRQVFLTAIVDPQGNGLTLRYDGRFRLVAVKDAVGQVIQLTYGLNADPYKITAVTDPFGRTARFGYTEIDGSFFLTSITDVLGLTSTFAYDGTFVHAMKTPYGTTRFSHAENYGVGGTSRSLDAVDPLGGHERTEYAQGVSGLPFSDSVVPAGMSLFNAYLDYRVTYFWDKHAMQVAPGDYTQAKSFHFQHTADRSATAGLLEAVKNPLESRLWFNYPGQGESAFILGVTVGKPAKIGRILDATGDTQLSQYAYNGSGTVTQAIDPEGRTTAFTYAPNGIDLVEVQQKNGSGLDTLLQATYNAQHLPLAVTDAAGQTTTLTYNALGQPTSVTNALGETTRFVYGAASRLQQVIDAQGQPAATFTYDGYGRVRTYADAEGYTVGYLYDALDRVTQVFYPDQTTASFTYTHLDLTQSKDRLGRATVYHYNPLRQMTAVTDPLGRVTRFDYCTCGVLDSVTDANGSTTQFSRDVESRLTAKVYADHSQTAYAYDLAGRLSSQTDAKGQTTAYQYGLDSRLVGVQYAAPTPGVSFTYDASYGRLTAMTDALGTTTYGYIPAGHRGALRLGTERKPAGYGTITYGYDALGRAVTQSLDGAADTVNYDHLGRMANERNALGSFAYTYVGQTGNLAQVDNPNGQRFAFSYYGDTGNRRLQQISQLTQGGPTANPVAQYGYDYNAAGDITSWSQQDPQATPFTWKLGYDGADQLHTVSSPGGLPAPGNVTASYAYDKPGNLVQVTNNARTFSGTYNGLNQAVQLSGTFGTTFVTDALNYDANGNLESQSSSLPWGERASFSSTQAGGSRTYQWDGADRLTSIGYGAAPGSPAGTTQLTYDGLSRLVRIVEKTGPAITLERRFVWSGQTLCQERGSQGKVVKQFFAQGVSVEAANTGTPQGRYYYGRDHLGSIRSLTDATGHVRAVYEYDPYGARQKLAGDASADFGFTGLFCHARSQLCFAFYRAYDPGLKRWLNRDPIGEKAGPNLYIYALNNPLKYTDRTGTIVFDPRLIAIAAVGGGIIGYTAGPNGHKIQSAIVGAIVGGVGVAVTPQAGAEAGAAASTAINAARIITGSLISGATSAEGTILTNLVNQDPLLEGAGASFVIGLFAPLASAEAIGVGLGEVAEGSLTQYVLAVNSNLLALAGTILDHGLRTQAAGMSDPDSYWAAIVDASERSAAGPYGGGILVGTGQPCGGSSPGQP